MSVISAITIRDQNWKNEAIKKCVAGCGLWLVSY